MKKKLIFIIIPIIAIALLCAAVFTLKKYNEVIIQGEVEVKTIDIASKVTGRVEKINVKEGDSVKCGDILLVVDVPDIAAKSTQGESALEMALAQAQKANKGSRQEQIAIARSQKDQAYAGLELAKKTYNRMLNLYNEGVIPAQKLDEAQAQHTSAKKAYESAESAYNMYLNGTRIEDKETAQANVRRAKGALDEVNSYLKEKEVKAAISGEVSQINAEVGELISAGYPIVTIADLNDAWVVFNLREDLLSKIKMGTVISAKFPALDNKKIDLKVTYIAPLGTYANFRATKARGEFDMKTFEIKATPVNKVEGLRAGMSAVVEWNKIK